MTRRHNGSWVATPVWFVIYGQCLYLRTIRKSHKVWRIRNYPGVMLAPCDEHGKLCGDRHQARARLMDAGEPLIAPVEDAMQARYGERRTQMTEMMARQGTELAYVELSPLP